MKTFDQIANKDQKSQENFNKVEEYNKFIQSLTFEYKKLKNEKKLTPGFCDKVDIVYNFLKSNKNLAEAYSQEGSKGDSMFTSVLLFNVLKTYKLKKEIEKKSDVVSEAEKDLLTILDTVKEIAFNFEFNEDRKNLREAWTEKGGEYNKKIEKIKDKGDNGIFFDQKKIEHLEEYLTDRNKPEELKEKILENLNDKSLLAMFFNSKKDGDFKKFLIGCSKIKSELDLFEILDKMLASVNQDFIKENFKIDLIEKQDKLRLVRAIRFGRVNIEEVERDVKKLKKDEEKARNEIFNNRDLAKIAGPVLRDKNQEFINLVKSTMDDEDQQKRGERLWEFVEKNTGEDDNYHLFKLLKGYFNNIENMKVKHAVRLSKEGISFLENVRVKDYYNEPRYSISHCNGGFLIDKKDFDKEIKLFDSIQKANDYLKKEKENREKRRVEEYFKKYPEEEKKVEKVRELIKIKDSLTEKQIIEKINKGELKFVRLDDDDHGAYTEGLVELVQGDYDPVKYQDEDYIEDLGDMVDFDITSKMKELEEYKNPEIFVFNQNEGEWM